MDTQNFEQTLIEAGLVTEDEIARAKAEASRRDCDFSEALAALGIVSEADICRALAESQGLPFVPKISVDFDPSIVSEVPARFVTHYRFFPMGRENGVLRVAMAEPPAIEILDEIRRVLKCRVEPALMPRSEIDSAVKTHYGLGADTLERMITDSDIDVDGQLEAIHKEQDVTDETIDASIIKYVNQLLMDAIDAEATDIHIEPFEDDLRIRYRIDGVLHLVPAPPAIRSFHASIVSRIKVMSDLNIAERRLPQDGRIRIRIRDDEYDLRVSIIPTPHGETVNLRILRQAGIFLGLGHLGLRKENRFAIEKMIQRPHGIILVTGPTGSGKTTTLYACLQKLNSTERKTITVEDPIEYRMKGVSQMQVHPKIGLTFSAGLRSMLRHDPDVMLVGEIRDYETAEIAIRSALTGHLVFSTLHTNDSTGALTRLTDMGVEPFLITSTLISSIAQRLVRRICAKCSESYEPEDEEFASVGENKADWSGETFYRGKGCDACKYTGYRGRIAIYELLSMSPDLKQLVLQRQPTHLIREKAVELGMTMLHKDGFKRIVEGVTSFEEVRRVAQEEEISVT